MASEKAVSGAHRAGRPAIILFDDGGGCLSPLTDLRPAFAVRTGAFSLLERLGRAGWKVSGVFVPMRLGALAAETLEAPVNDASALAQAVEAKPGGERGFTVLNARCVLPPEGLSALRPGQAISDAATGEILAARLDGGREGLAPLAAGSWPDVEVVAERTADTGGGILSRPWHVRTFRDRALAFDMQFAPAHHQFAPPALVAGGTPVPLPFTAFGAHPLYVHPTARLCPACMLDLEHGPIWIDAGATIRPGATVIGPCYVGPHSTVVDHALVKAGTSVGPWCKIGGEVGGIIFQGFANKAHDGHLGDSWVGEWANLGAGTTNSNLLNTYGEVVAYATPGGSAERTGEQFLGSIIGDHARFAICTRLMTGAIVGTGVMWAATAPVTAHVRPFAWVTDAGERTYRLEKFLDVARTVMSRRGVQMSAAYSDALRRLKGAQC